jgi:hypothetical protein
MKHRNITHGTVSSIQTLWEIPELGVDVGLFWWWNHQNNPTYPFYYGDSQRLSIHGL